MYYAEQVVYDFDKQAPVSLLPMNTDSCWAWNFPNRTAPLIKSDNQIFLGDTATAINGLADGSLRIGKEFKAKP